MTQHTVTKVEKPWGYELHWAQTENYVGKILFIKAGESLSIQYHRIKDETIFIHEGKMAFYVGTDPDALERIELTPGMAYRIPPGTIHQMEGLEDCTVLEASTPHLEDVVRLKDRYGRTQ